MIAACIPHAIDIKRNIADAQSKWDAGDWYGSGLAVGKVEAIALRPWMNQMGDEFLQ